MSENLTYRGRKDPYGYFTNGYYAFRKQLDLYSLNLKEFDMYKRFFQLETCYNKLSKDSQMLFYFDLKEKTIEIKFLENKTNKELYSDTYSLNPSRYQIVRRTVNHKDNIETMTMVNPSARCGHVSMYSAGVVGKDDSYIKIFRNKTDFMTNYDCVYTINDPTQGGKYLQVEKDLTPVLLPYANDKYPTSASCGAKPRPKGVKSGIKNFKSNKDTLAEIESATQDNVVTTTITPVSTSATVDSDARDINDD